MIGVLEPRAMIGGHKRGDWKCQEISKKKCLGGEVMGEIRGELGAIGEDNASISVKIFITGNKKSNHLLQLTLHL